MPVTIQTRGFREAERNLLAFAREFGPRGTRTAVNRALRASFGPVEEEIRRNTPVDEGTLQASTNLRVGATTSRDRRNDGIGPNVFAIARAGWFWSGESLWFQATNVEYGNSNQRPANVLRSALENNVSRILADLAGQLNDEITRATRIRRRRR